MADGKVTIKVDLDARDASTQTKRLRTELDGLNRTNAKNTTTTDRATGSTGKLSKASMALGNFAGNMLTKAWDGVTASMDNAIKRVDTLNNYPKVMKNLGYSTTDAQDSINRMSDAIDGLPTSLDDMASVSQRLAPITGDLGKATDLTIALNDAFLASGASSADVSRGMLQYTQMLAKGKVDMQSWRTLQETMPGQLKQVAQALLGPTANSQDLYEAMKDGKVSFDDFNKALMDLDKNGSNGFASFKAQAYDATAGIGTAMENVQNRISKAIAKVIDAIGAENISAMINNISSGFVKAGELVATVVGSIKDSLDNEALQGAAEAFQNAIGSAFPDDGGEGAKELGDVIADLVNNAAGLIQSLAPLIEAAANEIRYTFEVIKFGVEIIATAIGAIAQIVQAIQQIPAGLQSMADTAAQCWDAFVQSITGAIDGLVADITGAWNAIVADASAVPGRVAAWFAQIPGKVGGYFASLLSTARSRLNGIISAAQSIPGKVVAAFKGMGARIASAIGSIKPRITWETVEIQGAEMPARIPHITWNAAGGLYNSAAIIGLAEAGKEAAVPLRGRGAAEVGAALVDAMPQGSGPQLDEQRLFDALALIARLLESGQEINVDGRAFGRVIRRYA